MCTESLYLTMLSVWWRGSVYHSIVLTVKNPNKMQQCIKMFIIPYFKWSPTCFGRHTAHYQEPKTAQAASGFAYVEGCRTCSCWTLSGSVRCICGRPAQSRTQHDCHHDTKVKPEAATAVIELLMMGGKTPKTCWAINKRQDNKLKNSCIWLVIYLNCTMMHGLTNLKSFLVQVA
jgi:hypothetical protein